MARRYLTVLLLPLLPQVGVSKKPPPGGLGNIPGLGGLGGGPPWRKAIDKVFDEACAMNKGRPSVFCFPDKKELLEGLQVEQYGLDLTDETFLMDLHVVVDTMLQWPPAWTDLIDVLSPKRAWTKAFCDKIIGSPWWKSIPVVRKSFIRPGQTMVQMEKDAPVMVVGMQRWLETLRNTKDDKTRKLVQDFKQSDAADAKNKSCHARPMMRMMMHVHAKTVQHIVGKACKGSAPALEKFKKGDENGMTLLHHLASLGDTSGAKAILKAFPKAERAPLVARRDEFGYTAEDWANLGDFPDLAEAIRGFRGAADPEPKGAGPPAEPRKLFPVADAPADGSAESSQCSSDSSSPSCSAANSGGWRQPALEEVPREWMPPPDAPCAVDAIDVAQFDFDTFMRHYVLHPRPLLIRGGVQLPAHVLANYTRDGLLEVAGEQKITAQRFPEEWVEKAKNQQRERESLKKDMDERVPMPRASKQKKPLKLPLALTAERARTLLPEVVGCILFVDDRNERYRTFYTTAAGGRWSASSSYSKYGHREAQDYDGSKPVKKSLREYVDSLSERADSSSAKKKLHYAWLRLKKEEVALNFSATMPSILAGKVEQGGAVFYLGGLFMGTPPRYHGPAADSLVHGAKLWFLEPPGREVIVYEAMHDYLVRTGGAPGASRCLQQAGDVFYVPRAWSYGTICLGDCVGASQEFSHKRWDLRY